MNRRQFLRLGAGPVAVGTGLVAFGQSSSRPQTAPAGPAIDADRLAARAVAAFGEGRTCSEAMLAAGSEALGIRSDLLPDIAMGLGGGLGQGHTCGVLTGAALVVSLAAAVRHPDRAQRVKAAMAATGQVCKDFERQFGAVECRKLKALKLPIPEDAPPALRRKWPCSRFVEAGARLLAARLQGS